MESSSNLLALVVLAGLLASPADVGTTGVGHIQIEFVDGSGAVIEPGAELGIFHPDPEIESPEAAPQRFKILVRAPDRRPSLRLAVVSVDPATGRRRDRLSAVELRRRGAGRYESPWLVLVPSAEDCGAPALIGRALRTALGDRVEARVRRGGGRAVGASIRVGFLDDDLRPAARLRLSLSVTVLRESPGGPPVVGADAEGARELIAHQLTVLNEVLAQCGIWAGRPENGEVRLADPPGSSMLAIGGRYGFYSAGGMVRMRIDETSYGPWRLGAGYAPVETARALGRRLTEAGFGVEVAENPRNRLAAHASADLLVRRSDGSLAQLAAWPDQPLTTDPRQPLEIGTVRLDDGLDPYGPNEVLSGTLEERTLIRALARRERGSVELFVVNRFTGQAKQGESFARAAGQLIGDIVVLDWRALARARQAFTLPHEIGHVLLGDLGHPDGRGDPRPWLLMNSRASSVVGGPRRLTASDCATMREWIANGAE